MVKIVSPQIADAAGLFVEVKVGYRQGKYPLYVGYNK